MQCAVIEIARHLAGLDTANSSEFNPDTPHAVIDLLPEQRSIQDKGGTMRLGAFPCTLVPETLASKAYEQTDIHERHRILDSMDRGLWLGLSGLMAQRHDYNHVP